MQLNSVRTAFKKNPKTNSNGPVHLPTLSFVRGANVIDTGRGCSHDCTRLGLYCDDRCRHWFRLLRNCWCRFRFGNRNGLVHGLLLRNGGCFRRFRFCGCDWFSTRTACTTSTWRTAATITWTIGDSSAKIKEKIVSDTHTYPMFIYLLSSFQKNCRNWRLGAFVGLFRFADWS